MNLLTAALWGALISPVSGQRGALPPPEPAAEVFAASAARGRLPAPRLSRSLRSMAAASPADVRRWWQGPGQEWRRPRLAVLNTSGGVPPSAAVLVYRSGSSPWGRRLHMIVEDGRWVVDDVCFTAERQTLRRLLAGDQTREDC